MCRWKIRFRDVRRPGSASLLMDERLDSWYEYFFLSRFYKDISISAARYPFIGIWTQFKSTTRKLTSSKYKTNVQCLQGIGDLDYFRYNVYPGLQLS